MKEEWKGNLFIFLVIVIIFGALTNINESMDKKGYVNQHTMWIDGQEYLYTFIYKDGDIHSFEKDSINLVTDSIKELRIKTAEETLKKLR